MSNSNSSSGKADWHKTDNKKSGETNMLANNRKLRADNYPKSRNVRVSVHVVNEPNEIIKLKELAIAQTVRAVFERTLLLKLKGCHQPD